MTIVKVAKMKFFSKDERRNVKDRRSGKKRRQYDDPQYNGSDRRMMEERRLNSDRRAQIMADRHFHY